MDKIPQVTFNKASSIQGILNRRGSMCNAYSPFKNLSDKETLTIGDFTTELLNFDLQHPVDILPQDNYDGAVNLILNDGKNTPKLINSRFSVVDGGEFKVPDHAGYKDTNLYDESTFEHDTSIKPIAKKIPKVEFKGLTPLGGTLKCGAYTFYFKLSDTDGNESEVLAESGLVQLFIGGTDLNGEPDPRSIRMGLEDEDTGKSVTFKISNIDSGFDYIHVLFARSSSGNELAATNTYHKVIFNYPVTGEGESVITITGNELIIGITEEELYTDYADIGAAKTQTIVNNILFFGNLTKKERDWEALKRASWKIIPFVGQESNVGSIDYNYHLGGKTKESRGVYYNPYNVYYRVGYWPDELYRFGIVYIFNDNSLSPVFNIQGIDFKTLTETELSGKPSDIADKFFNPTLDGYEWENEPDDFYFNKKYRLNSRGVVRFPKYNILKVRNGVITPSPLYIKFDLNYMGYKKYGTSTRPDIDQIDTKTFFELQDIKGFFFVRQTRIPTIIAQGVAIYTTLKDLGALPVIKHGSSASAQSFLNAEQLLFPEGTNITIPQFNVSNNGMLVPDAEVSEATFNQLFVSNKYALENIASQSFFDYSNYKGQYCSNYRNVSSTIFKRKLTNVLDSVKTISDGEVYFSTVAGVPEESYKTKDVGYVWNKTKPQDLSTSTSLVRGNWGPFVGVGTDLEEDNQSLFYGGVYNIRPENYASNEESALDLDFQRRFNAGNTYLAVCDRTQYEGKNTISCYRGDCFVSLFTHRMFRNFIDPELPTNDKIINPKCWAQNYAVRCTALEVVEPEYNVYPENEGWYVTPKQEQDIYANEIVQSFEIKENDEYGNITWDAKEQVWRDKDGKEMDMDASDQLGGINSVKTYLNAKSNKIKVVKPSEQELQGLGGILKNIFKSSRWALRGLSSINRADVNAVGLGQWITFPICSSKNLSLRDIDYSNATEQASFNRKRSFYPLQEMDVHNPLRDSNVINQAASISIPHKKYYGMPNVPFIKQEYFTRVISSLKDSSSTITNEFKIMLENAYRDYTKVYGSITKLVDYGSNILVIFEHGIGVLSIGDSVGNAETPAQYLPVELNIVLTDSYGSIWKDSVIKTPHAIYGVDSVAKVIWKVSGDMQFEIISTMKVEKFLIDSLEMSEFVKTPYIGRINIKSHYNAFKQDVMFTYYNDVLYKFEESIYDDKNLSDYDIDVDGYLLDPETKERTGVRGEKVVAKYNIDTGHVDTYSDIIYKCSDEERKTFKWAEGKSWSICWNEIQKRFVTFYDWIPVESENIDNIYFSFDREELNKIVDDGVRKSYLTLRKPKAYYSINATENEISYRDAFFNKNEIDNAFNSTCSVNYIGSGISKYVFEDIKIPHNKLTTLGFYIYIKDNSRYNITFIKDENGNTFTPNILKCDDENYFDDGWFFIVAQVADRSGSTDSDSNYKLEITAEEGCAITDLIIKSLDFEDEDQEVNLYIINSWADRLLPAGIGVGESLFSPSQIEMEDFYFVRDLNNSVKLWKHGQAGVYDNADEIKPTKWYGKQREFNFEFIARKDALHKIFTNLLIISNKSEPKKFEVEVVGEVYEWHNVKPVLKWISDLVNLPTSNPHYEEELQLKFKEVLSKSYGELCEDRTFPKVFGMKSTDQFKKLPYLKVTDAVVPSLDPQIIGSKRGEKDKPNTNLTPEQQGKGQAFSDNTVTTALVYDKQLNEYRVHTEQLGNNMSKYGRLRGNMQYLEDLWKVELRPISFRYVYVEDDELKFTPILETRSRDKFVKIKIRYSGEDLTVIQSVATLFDYSYA